jgi:protein TonB
MLKTLLKFSISFLIFICISGRLLAQAVSSPYDTAVAAKHNEDGTFTKVDIESEFPGGVEGWRQFLTQHLKYPNKAVRKEIQGDVVVQFIVQKDGTLSDIHAISGPDLLRESAENVLKQSPPWKPAMQNGRYVKSYKKQPIKYRLERAK